MSKISHDDKILVAGAYGMVGSSICRELKKYGYGNKKKNGLIFTPTRKDLNYLNYESVQKWFLKNNPSVVIVCAAKVGGILANAENPTEFLLENIKIQTNLIETAWKHGVKRLLFLGSSCIYPKFANQPIKEESLLGGYLEPTNEWYALAKISGIKLCEALRSQYKFDAISLMPTNLYGTGDNYDPGNSHVMPALIKKFCEAVKNSHEKVNCWGSGTPLREFLHVDDLASASRFVLENWDPDAKNAPLKDDGNPLLYLNVGTGKDISIKNLTFLIADLVGFKGEIIWDKSKPDGTPKKQLNIEKISSLGWSPKINLTEGIVKTINEYKTQYLFN